MARYKAIIAYDGTHFKGFQRQNDARTIQGELEKTLYRLNGKKQVTVHGAGRTDAGVHAMGQVIHFDLAHERDEEKLRFALDTQSSDDIAVLSVQHVADDFHSRYAPHEKVYQYRVSLNKVRSPFERYYMAHFPYEVDIEAMKQGAQALIGTHDFTSFCATGTSVEDKVRTIYDIHIDYDDKKQTLVFTYYGNGFLYKMVRLITGTLLRLGNGRLDTPIATILENKDQQQVLWTAPAEGLYLMEVKYDEDKEDHV